MKTSKVRMVKDDGRTTVESVGIRFTTALFSPWEGYCLSNTQAAFRQVNSLDVTGGGRFKC